MDATKLQEIEARANVATAWVPDECELEVDPEDGYVYAPQGATLGQTLITLGDTYEGSGEDWSFVAHARTDVPDLLAEVRRLTAALATARREGAEEVMAMSSPWPLHDVLAKLTEASRALLNRYNYDGHGWEQILAACDSADAIIARIHARALPLDGDGGAT